MAMSISTVIVLQMFLVLPACGFDLLILHTNDFHDRIEEINKYSGSCSRGNSAAGKCFGGVSRLRTKINELRDEHPNSLLLDAGDQFQGTLWFYKFGGELIATFMNLLGFDAMGLGNHEFDLGVAGVLPLVNDANFSILSSNIDLRDTPSMQGKVQKSKVFTVGGERVGVIGYTTKQTPYISNPETIKFTDEFEAIQAEANRLTAAGVNKVIALGHGGYLGDLNMARRLTGVDVIVGGHSNTLLYNGDAPSNEDSVGSYPTVVVSSDSGEEVLVVQAYAFGKYLGRLHLSFDDEGRVTNYSGNPVLLDSSVAKDNETEAIIADRLPQIDAIQSELIGYSHVTLDGDVRVCRIRECNLGNVITDAMLKQNVRASDSSYWSDVSIALMNSGGIRSSIEKGPVTVGDAIKVQPFRNTVDIVELSGATIMKILEHGASLWTDGDDLYGGFLQVSGLRIVYDMTKPVGQKVKDVQVRCAKCDVPSFQPINLTEIYQVLMNAFLANGGDQYSMIPAETIRTHTIGNVDLDLFVDYVKANSPIVTGVEGRIRFIQEVRTESLTQELALSVCTAVEQSCTRGSASGLTANIGIAFFSFIIMVFLTK